MEELMDILKLNDLDTAAFFTEVGKPLAKAKTIKETLDVLMYQVGCIFQPVNWSLLLKEPKTGNMIFTVVVGANKEKLQGVRIPKGEGIVGHIMDSGESIIVQNVNEDKRFSERMDEATGFKTQSIIGVPLKADEKIFGVIELINKISGDNFTEVEMHLLSSIAEYAAIAIERSYYNQALKKMALTDALTGLKNSLSFERTLKNKIEMMKRYNVLSAMLFIDISRFSAINDRYGYPSGDRLLRGVAKLIHASFRSVDEVFRYKGDKFAVIMPLTNLDSAEQAKERFLKKLKSARFLDDKITISAEVSIRFVDANVYHELNALTRKRKSMASLDNLSRQAMENQARKSNALTEKSDLPELLVGELSLDEDLSCVDESDIQNIENNLHPMLSEEGRAQQKEDEAQNKIKFEYRDVTLSGEYRHITRYGQGYITIVKLSIKGVCFKTLRQNNLSSGDMLDITFTLDDSRQSLIERKVTVESVDGQLIEANYYNPPPYDKNLGFYLMA